MTDHDYLETSGLTLLTPARDVDSAALFLNLSQVYGPADAVTRRPRGQKGSCDG